MNDNQSSGQPAKLGQEPEDEPGQSSGTAAPSGGGMIAWLKGLVGGSNELGLKQSVEEVLSEHEDSGETIAPGQREMLLNILGFGELSVDDVMVPRADIIAIDIESDLEEITETFCEAHHSRLPVYRGNLDEVVGFVHIKDLLVHSRDKSRFVLADILRQPLFVPHSMPATDLLIRMRASRIHMAIVVDEYGGADGLVTIEDVVEEIVGDIEDEHDQENAPLLIVDAAGVIEADARVLIEDFEERFDVDLLPDSKDEEVDTLGGLIFAMSGRVPETGEVLRHKCGLDFEVVDADPRRIKRLRIKQRHQPSHS